MAVRSAGMSAKSPHRISGSDLEWADLVLVMETKYKSQILDLFRSTRLPPIKSLDIPDEYGYMDNELVDLITTAVEHQIETLGNAPDPTDV